MALQINLTSGPDLWNPLIDPLNPVTEAVELSALQGNDTITGTAFNDLIFGNQDNDLIDPAAGNDTVYGGQGNDTIIASLGDNLLLSNEGDDYIEVSGGNNTVYGGVGNDTIIAVNGNNLLLGNQDNDLIEIRSGNNTAYGGVGNDTIIAQAGNNILLGNQNNDYIQAGTGNDTVYGGQGNDTIIASTGTDVLYGNEADDTFLLSGQGVVGEGDVFDGGEGNDRLEVDANNDLSSATVTAIETIAVASTATLIASLENLANVTNLAGNGTIQILAATTAINQFLTTLGEGVATTLTIRDEDANIIQGGSTTDPDDNIPIGNTLKVGQDEITSSGRFNAPVIFQDAIGNIPTLESVDVLEGTGDADILTATMDGTVFGGDETTLQIVPRITGIETISIRAIKDVGYDAINTRGTTTFISSASPSDLDITKLQELPTDFIARNNSGSLTATIADSVLSGGDDSVNITLENTNALGEVISIGSIRGNEGIETFNVFSTGVIPNRIDRIIDNGDFVTTVNISGDNSLELVDNEGVFSRNTGVINASDLEADLILNDLIVNGDLTFTGGTGNVDLVLTGRDLTFTAGTGNVDLDVTGRDLTYTGGTGDVDLVLTGRDLTYTGGNGNVNLDFSAVGNRNLKYVGGEGDVNINMGGNLSDADAIDGGTGNNQITATFIGNPGALEISNVQTLNLTTDNTANISFADSDDSIELIRLTNIFANPPQLTIDAIKSLPTIEFRADGQGTNQNTNPGNPNSRIFSPVTILSTGVSGTDDTLTVEINNRGNQLDNAFGYQFNGVRADAVENIVINVADGNLNFTVNDEGQLVNLGVPGDVSARGLQSLTVTSAGNVRLGNIFNPNPDTEAANSINSIDATGVEGRFIARSEDLAGGAVVNLGNGGATFDASLSTTNGITINGGSRNDILTGSQGNDIITGNAGNDRISLTSGGNDLVRLNQVTSTDTIIGFALADADNQPDDQIGLSNATYGSLSAGQKFDILTAGGYNALANNVGSTIVQGSEAEIQGLGNNNTTRVRFVAVTGADANDNGSNDTVLFYSANGSFANLTQANQIAIMDGLNGFTLGDGSNEIIPIA